RDGAYRAHAAPEHRLPRHFDIVVFRGLRRGHRLPHLRDRWDQLWRVHRARTDHVVAVDAEHLQCLVRDLFSQVHGNDLRAFVGAAATKSIILGVIILATAGLFVPLHVAHPYWMILFLVLTAATFSLLGFVIGIWADGFEKLQLVPLLIVTPLTFLGGSFYSI